MNIIKLENVTVRFNIASERVDNLKEYVIKLIKRQLMFQEFFALKDINLEIEQGQAWGIVGTNGSGKSTLLKLLCGILKPYSGKIITHGTMAPLIELGAGFDGDLSARENIYLNGTILGYSEHFIAKHFNEIVDFAELWDFLDMPIKNYSSGMAARLGFAIATTVQPDILIVDEVLSVGDFLFKEKCEIRMKEMMSRGTTLIYVSHEMNTVKGICTHALWLDKGTIKMSGKVDDVCTAYEKMKK